jgi:hypothetical protein
MRLLLILTLFVGWACAFGSTGLYERLFYYYAYVVDAKNNPTTGLTKIATEKAADVTREYLGRRTPEQQVSLLFRDRVRTGEAAEEVQALYQGKAGVLLGGLFVEATGDRRQRRPPRGYRDRKYSTVHFLYSTVAFIHGTQNDRSWVSFTLVIG